MIKIFFERENRVVEVDSGETLLNAALKAGVEVHSTVGPEHHCFHPEEGCLDCAVSIKQGASGMAPRTALERSAPASLRLACQARAFGNVVVTTVGEDGPRFLPDTAAPAWGIFSGVNTGVAPEYVPSLLRM
jgi:ferredoxin